jgi:hypothetical protein
VYQERRSVLITRGGAIDITPRSETIKGGPTVRTVSPKVGAATLAAAFATVIWTLVASLSPGTFTEAAISSLTGATGTILAFVLGFAISDSKRTG